MATDRNLLFGLLALQNGVINQGQLVLAFQAWTLDKSKSLADHLQARGDLTGARRALLEGLLDIHLEAHGGDVEKSLAAVSIGKSTRESLARLGDPDIDGTLGHVGSSHGSTDDGDADRTTSYAVGTVSSDGQRFRVLRPHARGGLGAVFVALDAELNREVALKQILDHHADDPTSRTRFLTEAEITGGLEHPGIVPVYGLGTYADGRPFYAMRFIRGDSLKTAIAAFHANETLKSNPGRRSLELRKLLRRFIDVCNAIEYAHSRGVLHRDIKPGNVIVGKHGETLVVDWGLAKATGKGNPGAEERTLRPSSASGSAETLPGSALGTPAYMSPEQARGELENLGPRSDVYSLGGALYCLLTGKAPQEGDDIGEILQRVQGGDFTPPRSIDPGIDRALEAISCRAMAYRPEDRYPGCRSLAEDIERWMADEPVTAWREPWARKLLRWLTRHRTSVTGVAAALLVALVGLGAIAAVQARANAELKQSRAAVQARYDLAVDAIKTFHTGVSEDFLLKQDQFKELRDRLLRSAAEFYGKLSALLGKETDVASRRALAQSNYELAGLTARVGRREDALAAHRAVSAAREALAAEPGAGAQAKLDLSQSLIAIAELLDATGKADDAMATYTRAEGLLAGPANADPMARAALARCRSSHGYLLSRTGKAAESLASYRLARGDQEELVTAPSAAQGVSLDLADTLNRIGLVLKNTGRTEEAEAEYRGALVIYQKLADDSPAVISFHSQLAQCRYNIGILLAETGKRLEAETEFRKALAVYRKLTADNPAVVFLRNRLAGVHYELANLLCEHGKMAESEAEYRESIMLRQRLVDDNPEVISHRSGLALSHNSLGLLLSDTGRPAEAEAEYRRAVTILQKLVDDHPAVTHLRNWLAASHANLGLLLNTTGKPAEAEVELRAAMAIYQKLADDIPDATEVRNYLAVSQLYLGEALSGTGWPQKAEAEYRAAQTILQKLADKNPNVTDFRNRLATSHVDIGNLLAQSGKPTEAAVELRAALAISRKLADDNPNVIEYREGVANCGNYLSVVLRRVGRPAEARELCEQAVAVREALVKEHPETPGFRYHLAENHLNRGLARLAEGDVSAAAADLRRATELYKALQSLPGEQLFLFASAHAALSVLAGQRDSGVSASEADTAMALLNKAFTMGFRNADAYRTEDALDSLRGRDNFRLLMMDVAFPAQPFALSP